MDVGYTVKQHSSEIVSIKQTGPSMPVQGRRRRNASQSSARRTRRSGQQVQGETAHTWTGRRSRSRGNTLFLGSRNKSQRLSHDPDQNPLCMRSSLLEVLEAEHLPARHPTVPQQGRQGVPALSPSPHWRVRNPPFSAQRCETRLLNLPVSQMATPCQPQWRIRCLHLTALCPMRPPPPFTSRTTASLPYSSENELFLAFLNWQPLRP